MKAALGHIGNAAGSGRLRQRDRPRCARLFYQLGADRIRHGDNFARRQGLGPQFRLYGDDRQRRALTWVEDLKPLRDAARNTAEWVGELGSEPLAFVAQSAMPSEIEPPIHEQVRQTDRHRLSEERALRSAASPISQCAIQLSGRRHPHLGEDAVRHAAPHSGGATGELAKAQSVRWSPSWKRRSMSAGRQRPRAGQPAVDLDGPAGDARSAAFIRPAPARMAARASAAARGDDRAERQALWSAVGSAAARP